MPQTLMDVAEDLPTDDTEQASAANEVAEAPEQGVPGSPPTDADPEAGGRPDYIPEKFWDPDKGQARIEELAKSQRDFETKYRNREGTKVEKADEYEIAIPEGADHVVARDEEGNLNDPLIQVASEVAVESGMSKEMFEGFVSKVAEKLGGLVSPYDPKAEIEAMGPKGTQIVNQLTAKTRQLIDQGVLNDEQAAVFKNMWATADTAPVLAAVFDALGEKSIPDVGGEQPGPVSDVELDMMYHETYEDGPYKGQRKYAVDKAHAARVDALFEKRYGKGPGRTSIPMGG
ncbi:MAG: hypothetical protein K0U84_13595 [Actinomycetia bacterium]|nr:hypothetical protein [Actinomycetes bacterium]